MIRIVCGLMLLGACATAPMPPAPELASMPPEQPRLITPVEITGDYAGRPMKLTIDGRVVHDGPAEARPAGTRWIEEVAPGAYPAPLILELEGCPTYRAEISRTGGLHAVAINGCDVMLIGS